MGKAAAQAMPNIKLVELEGVGHEPQVKVFDLVVGNNNQWFSFFTSFLRGLVLR